MNHALDTYELLRLVLDAVDQVVEDLARRTGSVESQRAQALARRARLRLDAASAAALREVG